MNSIVASNNGIVIGKTLSYASIRDRFAPYPYHTLLLGLADDGLPVLYNMRDQNLGKSNGMLIWGDLNWGRSMQRVMIDALLYTHPINQYEPIVITRHPEQWQGEDRIKIAPSYKTLAEEYLYSICSYAYDRPDAKSRVVLFVDDISGIWEMNFDHVQYFKHISEMYHKNVITVATVGEDDFHRVSHPDVFNVIEQVTANIYSMDEGGSELQFTVPNF